jgi:TATA-box binding protein (TBP) (component of TFIID and TFIIIB)
VYSCNPFIGNPQYSLQEKDDHREFAKIIDRNVNCINVCFTLNMEINRQRFYDQLIRLEYMCKYKPESYSGIKFIYKISAASDTPDGYCQCTSKCTCTNITFLIFQSGKVIATGFKSEEQIDVICSKFVTLCKTLKNAIQKRTVTVE